MDLYRQDMIDHYQNPRNYGEIFDADVIIELDNSSCGDKIKLFVKLKNDKIDKVSFTGEGCAVAIASASKLTEYAKGKDIKHIQELTTDDLLKIIKVDLTISRIKCANLSLETLKKSINSVDRKQKI
ncbi:iron-sulfur cluster assembly scaffold protein [Candidatus Dojkabacteria bacterium]|uniref:Iron-sulfur cluster assembly scaffold protein n=1 Tax=Candidatus Dojkabacteria bacterium TaxID=2099670 RepID=A0A955L0P1_9BACT|nr:iron-sulfur cluster assembly scaffold protein [Candidatus Dojkabacteria bacterium]